MIDDDGSGTTGTIINNAWKQEFYNQIDALAGAWVDVPFDPANFSSASGVWTVAAGFQVTLKYVAIQGSRLICLTYNLGGTATISASTTTLIVNLPGMPAAANGTQNSVAYWISSGIGTGLCAINQGGSSIAFNRDIGGTPFPAQTNAINYFRGELFFPY
jgi:uncharacterized Zn-binding protein involved in type VI secretion